MDAQVMTKVPNTVDAEIGARIRDARKAQKLSQSDIAILIGVSYQQVQKYENGTDRVAASRLLQIAEALCLPPSALLADERHVGTDEAKDEAKIIRAFRNIRDPRLREVAYVSVKTLADLGSSPNSARQV